MSKGHGYVQRGIIATLEAADGRAMSAIEIAAHIFDVQPDKAGVCLVTGSQTASTRRALYRLQESGLVFCVFIGQHGRSCWGTRDNALEYARKTRKMFKDMEFPAALERLLQEE